MILRMQLGVVGQKMLVRGDQPKCTRGDHQCPKGMSISTGANTAYDLCQGTLVPSRLTYTCFAIAKDNAR